MQAVLVAMLLAPSIANALREHVATERPGVQQYDFDCQVIRMGKQGETQIIARPCLVSVIGGPAAFRFGLIPRHNTALTAAVVDNAAAYGFRGTLIKSPQGKLMLQGEVVSSHIVREEQQQIDVRSERRFFLRTVDIGKPLSITLPPIPAIPADKATLQFQITIRPYAIP